MTDETCIIQRLRKFWPEYENARDRFARSVRIVPGPPTAGAGMRYDRAARAHADQLRAEILALMAELGWPRRIAEQVLKPQIGLQMTANDIRAALTGYRYAPKNDSGRLHGPAVDRVGRLVWFRDGVLHRDDGPAVITPIGDVEIWRDGVRCGSYRSMPQLRRAPNQAETVHPGV